MAKGNGTKKPPMRAPSRAPVKPPMKAFGKKAPPKRAHKAEGGVQAGFRPTTVPIGGAMPRPSGLGSGAFSGMRGGMGMGGNNRPQQVPGGMRTGGNAQPGNTGIVPPSFNPRPGGGLGAGPRGPLPGGRRGGRGGGRGTPPVIPGG